MAVKRSFSIKNKSHCACLKCGAQILPDDLKDNTVYKCAQCGQEMTVDRYDSRAVLTVIEKPELRRRVPPEIMDATTQDKADILKLLQEKESLKDQLITANSEIIKWQQAADGLARMIEEMKAKEGAGNV